MALFSSNTECGVAGRRPRIDVHSLALDELGNFGGQAGTAGCKELPQCDVLCEAAGFAQSENAQGVSTSIMTGQLANMGTGSAEVLFPHTGVEVRKAPTGRVLRSTCRSYTTRQDTESLEYVADVVRPTAARPLSPPTVEEERGGARKRARFRVVSPER